MSLISTEQLQNACISAKQHCLQQVSVVSNAAIAAISELADDVDENYVHKNRLGMEARIFVGPTQPDGEQVWIKAEED